MVLAAALLLLGRVAGAAEPRASAVRDPSPALLGLTGACREQVAAELRRGEISSGASCEGERRAAQRRQLQTARGRQGFGVVERARTGPTGASLLLSEARGCDRWPLRLPDRPTLGLFEAKASGCRVQRYNGPVTLVGVLPDGRRVAAVAVVQAREGLVDVDLVQVAVRLERRGLPGLDALARLELGVDGWAGSIDLAAVRTRLADMHAAAVQRGRGVPGLLPVRHPDHPAADRVRSLALLTTLRRQEIDLKAVQRGELSPQRFLERHAWSPYRQMVLALEARSE